MDEKIKSLLLLQQSQLDALAQALTAMNSELAAPNRDVTEILNLVGVLSAKVRDALA